jgi:hypothetical protein
MAVDIKEHDILDVDLSVKPVSWCRHDILTQTMGIDHEQQPLHPQRGENGDCHKLCRGSPVTKPCPAQLIFEYRCVHCSVEYLPWPHHLVLTSLLHIEQDLSGQACSPY